MTRTTGTLTPQIGGTNGVARSAAGTYSEEIIAATTGNLKFQADSTFAGTLDNVTVYAMAPLSSDYDGKPIPSPKGYPIGAYGFWPVNTGGSAFGNFNWGWQW